MASDDQQFVIDQWNYLFGRNPTQQELEQQTAVLASGVSRADFVKEWEKANPEEAVTRMFREIEGRDPTAKELADLSAGLRNGTSTRLQTRSWLTDTYLPQHPRTVATAGPSAEQESGRDYVNNSLRDWGLEGLSDFAWQEIQAGNSPERVIQDLRNTPEYKQRFQAMAQRQSAGLPAISESEYLNYESSAQQLMRAAGLPSGYYDDPSDYANFIGKNVSISELGSRINDGYLAVASASQETRDQLQALYGVGPGGMAAYFLDPDRALPLIQRQVAAAQASGAAVGAGYGALNQSEAERLASLGVSAQQAAQGFATLVDSKELFGNLPGEHGATIGRDEQQNAVFANDANARNKILKKGEQRVSAGSGAQSFALGQNGLSGLSREAT